MPDHVTARMDPNQRAFTPCPAGLQQAVCVDCVDLGWTTDQYKTQPVRVVHKVALVFQTAEVNEDTSKPWEPSIEFVVEQEFTDDGVIRQVGIFGEKSKLRKFLVKWRGGKEFTKEEALEGAPLDKLVGANAMLDIMHRESKTTGNTYAVIDSASGLPKGTPKIQPKNYERSAHWAKRREEYQEKLLEYRKANPTGFEEFPKALEEEEDDSLPF